MLTVNAGSKQHWKQLYELEGTTVMLLCGFLPIVGTAAQFMGSATLVPVAAVYGGVLLFLQRKTTDWKCPLAVVRIEGIGS